MFITVNVNLSVWLKVEVEIKLKIENPEALEERLKKYKFLGVHEEEDIYLNFDCEGGCCRDFAKTDEAIRIRRKDEEVILTYKGPRVGKEVKAREEIEVNVNDLEKTLKILEKLCLKPVVKIKKKRKEWMVNNFKVTIDYVEGLGWFTEIEGMGDPKELKEEIERLAKTLVPEGKKIEKTYLELYLEKMKS